MIRVKKLLPRLSLFALEVSIAVALVFFYFSLNSTRRPLEIFSCGNGNNNDHTFSNQTKGLNVPEKNHTTKELNNTKSAHQIEMTFQDILPLLQNASTDDRTVIITLVNEAWAAPNSLLDMFLESFHIGEKIEDFLNHLIIVTVDPKALNRCKMVHKHCYLLKLHGVDTTSEMYYMSNGYVELLWMKLALLQRILELGYNFLYTDVDVLWFRNPFKHISVYADMTASCDLFFGDPESLNNLPNMGFFYVKSTENTVKMLKYWRDARTRYPRNHEQNIFDKIKHEMVSELQLKIQFLDTSFIGGFCSHRYDLSAICTMHSNCCISLNNKLHDLRNVIADWKNYTSISVNDTKTRNSFTWHAPVKCIRKG